jgi:hypothetical protein
VWQVRYNLTKTVRKRPIDDDGRVLGEWFIDRTADIKHEARDARAWLSAAARVCALASHWLRALCGARACAVSSLTP